MDTNRAFKASKESGELFKAIDSAFEGGKQLQLLDAALRAAYNKGHADGYLEGLYQELYDE